MSLEDRQKVLTQNEAQMLYGEELVLLPYLLLIEPPVDSAWADRVIVHVPQHVLFGSDPADRITWDQGDYGDIVAQVILN